MGVVRGGEFNPILPGGFPRKVPKMNELPYWVVAYEFIEEELSILNESDRPVKEGR